MADDENGGSGPQPPTAVQLPDGTEMPPLADGEYDVIVLGTGLKECILSGILSVDGKKVLHMDRNDYYGGESASVNLNQLFERFKAPVNAALGNSRDYNIDLMPKFIMANGKLVKMLIMTNVNRYLEFKQVDGSYVMKQEAASAASSLLTGKTAATTLIEKVPATDMEAASTSLVGFFEKRRLRNFIIYVQEYEQNDAKTHKGHDLARMSCRELFEKFGLEKGTIDFIGHALALYDSDAYLGKAADDLIARCKLYGESLARYGKSPYLYPLYGLGELPQAFARLAAVYGGTYMLHKPVKRIVYAADGSVCGVVSIGEDGQEAYAKCKLVVGDPTYFPEKCTPTYKVVRCIAILSHPITPGKEASAQIILPQAQIGRQNDIYVFCVSSSHCVAPEGKYIAFVSTISNRSDVTQPDGTINAEAAMAELSPGLKLLGKVDAFFYDAYDVNVPKESGTKDKCYISKSYDPTSHFEQVSDDVMDMYERIYGVPLDLSKTMVDLNSQGDE